MTITNTQYTRGVDESLEKWIFRLYYNQKLYGLTNQEIGDIINQETDGDFDESAYRKPTRAKIEMFNEMYQEIYDEVYEQAMVDLDRQINPKPFQNVYSEQLREIEKAEVRLRDQRNELNSILRKEARADNLLKRVQSAAKELAEKKPLDFSYRPVQMQEDNVAVLQLSDWHFGEIIKSFLGEYDREVAKELLYNITSETIEYCKLHKVETLKVLNLGDLISGNIHISTRVNNDESAIHQILEVTDILKYMLYEFGKHIPLVEYHSTTDNHSRINKSYHEHIEEENFQIIIPHFLKEAFKESDNVKIVDNKIYSINEVDVGHTKVFDSDILFVHGHNDRIASMISDLSLLTKTFPIAIFSGHIHKDYEDEKHGTDLIVNPPLVTPGEYAKKIRASSKQAQKLTIFENINGEANRLTTYRLRGIERY